MARRVLPCVVCALVLTAPAAGADIERKKREIDDRISTLHSRIARANALENVLTDEITVVTAKIDALQNDVDDAQRRLLALEKQLAASQRKLDRLTDLYELQTRRLKIYRSQYAVALARLERRLIDAYEAPGVSAIDVLLASTSMSDMLSDIEYLQQVDRQDRKISKALHDARDAMQKTRAETRVTKDRAAAETAVIRARTDEQHSLAQQLISSQQQLATARTSKRDTLASIQENEREFVHEVEGLQAASASLAARIRAAQAPPPAAKGGALPPSSAPPHVSSSGLVWPVSGPITSSFGWRWGRMHEGVDIGVGYGTPIHAAASGTVIYAGWMSGYGNLVVIDHGNGLATAYGHQSSIAVGNGAGVSQGQVVGYVGCTGHCFGPHLHFEVRVNGTPVDPLGYL